MNTRRRFTAEFKATVALEAIRGERTIGSWRPASSHRAVGREAEVTRLDAKVGHLVERDF
jgi:transposase